MDGIDNINALSRFVLNAVAILAVCIGFGMLYYCCKSNSVLQQRFMFLIGGSDKMRYNAADNWFPVVGMLPSEVITIERIIVHDVPKATFESLDVFCEIDFGINMPMTTRVRQVQAVSVLEPNPWETNAAVEQCDKPSQNRVVFTDRMEFNVRPMRQSPMIIRVKDQDMIGADLLGFVEIDAGVLCERARENSGGSLNYKAALSFKMIDQHGRSSEMKTRVLVWFSKPKD